MLQNSDMVGFAEGTPILMATGEWKAIEKIREGEMVMSFDPTGASYDLVPRKVTNRLDAIYKDCLEVHTNNNVTVVAKDQLFFTPTSTFTPCFETKQVVAYDGSAQDIQVRKVRGGKWKIYDITVDGNHSLVANGLRAHNGGGGSNNKKKKAAPAQPIVTAGKPGQPVSITTTQKGISTTVTVNPPPGSSGQISVSGSSISTNTALSFGNSTQDFSVTYGRPIVLPYPTPLDRGGRVSNAQNLRDKVCGDMLSKGNNHKTTTAQAAKWKDILNQLEKELSSVKYQPFLSRTMGERGNGLTISIDNTPVDDALSLVSDLKKEISAGRVLRRGFVESTCQRIENLLERIDRYRDVPHVHLPMPRPLPPVIISPPICEPHPHVYHSHRIYPSDPSFAYMVEQAETGSFAYDPPNAPAQVSIRYYKHFDPRSGQFYFDRVRAGSVEPINAVYY